MWNLGMSWLVLVALFAVANGFNVNMQPRIFRPDEMIPLQVNKLTSSNTQIPYKYYTSKLDFCRPAKEYMQGEILGEVLRGDRIASSVYEIKAIRHVDVEPNKQFFTNSSCKVINGLRTVGNQDGCTNYSNSKLANFASFIEDSYKVHWIMDNLPAAYVRNVNNNKVYDTGFFLGESVDNKYVINNHVDIIIVYGAEYDGIVVIGFEVRPRSVNYDMDQWNQFSQEEKELGKCPDADSASIDGLLYVTPQEGDKKQQILWTYNVLWEYTTTPSGRRWDLYLASPGAQIHWISIFNSLVVVLILTMAVAITVRKVIRDKMNQPDEHVGEQSWTSLRGDVFRPPSYPALLAVLVGSGAQLGVTSVIILVLAMSGLFAPAQRGLLSTAFLVMFMLMAPINGYCATRLYKAFKGTNFKRFALGTALAFPGTIFALYFVINTILWSNRSSMGIPFGTLIQLLAFWLLVFTPLVLVGSYLAFRKSLVDPARTNPIPRPIPQESTLLSADAFFGVLLGGVLPFGVIFIEDFFVLCSLWGNQMYYIFGFLLIVFVILIVVCAEVSILMCHFQLNRGNHRWWWKSFLTSGSSAFYMFLYAIFFFNTSLDISRGSSTLIYFIFSLMIALCFFVFTGSIGFYASYIFVSKIYASIEVPEDNKKLLSEEELAQTSFPKALSFLPAIPLASRDLLMDIVLPERRV